MQARYYDPVIGRFYSNDPIDTLGHFSTQNGIHGFNRYAYANNNPYAYTDPTGMCSEEVSGSKIACDAQDKLTEILEPIMEKAIEALGATAVPEGERDPQGTLSHEARETSVAQEATAIAVIAIAARTGIELETPDNSPDSFEEHGKGKNKVHVNKKTGMVMQVNPAKHGGKSFNVWKNLKRFNKSKKRDTSVWADSGKDRGR